MAKTKTSKKTTTVKKAATAKKAVTAKKSTKKPSASNRRTKTASNSPTSTKTKPTANATKEKEVPVDRRSDIEDRRLDDDRRQQAVAVAEDRRTNPERRAKVNRRRQIDPTTCERDYNDDEIEFMHALDAYKRAAGRMFPTCSEILEVIRDLGYRRLTPEELAKFRPEELAVAAAAEGGGVDPANPDSIGAGLGEDEDMLDETLADFEG